MFKGRSVSRWMSLASVLFIIKSHPINKLNAFNNINYYSMNESRLSIKLYL